MIVIDLAKVRADVAAKAAGLLRGTFRALPVEDGNVAIELMDGERLLLRIDVTIAEARAFQEEIGRACFHAKYIHQRVHSLVRLAWCDTHGRPVREQSVRGRIAERTDTAVRIAIEPEQWQREPREGWPKAGWYRLSGWPTDHDPRRRGWRLVSGMPEVSSDG